MIYAYVSTQRQQSLHLLDVFWQSTIYSIPAYIACKLIQDNNKEGTATVTKSVPNAKKKKPKQLSRKSYDELLPLL